MDGGTRVTHEPDSSPETVPRTGKIHICRDFLFAHVCRGEERAKRREEDEEKKEEEEVVFAVDA